MYEYVNGWQVWNRNIGGGDTELVVHHESWGTLAAITCGPHSQERGNRHLYNVREYVAGHSYDDVIAYLLKPVIAVL